MKGAILNLILLIAALVAKAQYNDEIKLDSALAAAQAQHIVDSILQANVVTDSVEAVDTDDYDTEAVSKSYPSVDSMQQAYLNQSQPVHSFDQGEWSKATKDLDYSDKRPKPKEKHRKKTSSQDQSEPKNATPLSQLISIAVLVVVLAALLIFLLNYFGVKLSLGKKKKSSTVRDDTEQASETALERMLREALAQKNFREAVRIYYLMIIQEFSDRKWITWKKEKTNADYLYELKEPQHRGNFRKVTVIYERTWYGDYELDEKNFNVASEQMKNFISTIRKKS